jgi:pentapeptide MXKDX repeat protein
MSFALRTVSFAAITALSFALAPVAFAQDAMKADAMAPAAMATDAMAPMSDDDLKMCLEQAGMITFPHVMDAATAACHDMHNGMMGDAMKTDAMAPDAMAPAADAMAPATK